MARRLVLILLAFAAGFGAAQWRVQPVRAQAQMRQVVVPKAWGNFRAVYHDQLLFEDERGTIRSVYPNGPAVVFTVTRR